MSCLSEDVREPAGGEESDFAAAKLELDVAEPCYLLFRSDASEWTLISYVPDAGSVKLKMLYSSAKDTLRKALGGAERLPKEMHFSSLEEVALIEEQSATARAAEQAVLMTETERLKIEGNRLEAAEAAGEKLSSVVGLSFPLDEAAKSGFATFVTGETDVLILGIDAETIVCRATAPATPVAALVPMLPAEPCYCLYRWTHEREGSSKTSVLFMYLCPEEAPVRAKMLHASTKSTIVQSLPSLGIEVAKSIEGLERSEITDVRRRAASFALRCTAWTT